MSHPKRARRGFTLLEVMVALAILGLGLTSILSAQAGAFSSAVAARNMSEATGLARCKMSELEEHLLREGFQELDEQDSGPCCDDDDSSIMKCTWTIEKLKLPEPQYGQLNLDSDLNLSGPAAPSASSDPGDVLGGLAGGLGGLTGGAEGGDPGAGFASMLGPVTQMIFPVLQSIFETSTRRITVTVSWNEGSQEKSLGVMQWFVNSSGLAGAGGTSSSSSSTSSSGR